MVNWITFSKPPIEEALLDLRTDLPAKVDLARLEEFHNCIRERFPTKRDRFEFQGSIQLKGGGPPEMGPSSYKRVGFIFLSPDGKRVVQARLDGFSFSQLRPYESWQSLLEEAKGLWSKYLELVQPSMVTRVALRYINRITINLPMEDLKEYILTYPVTAPGMPGIFSEFFMRIVMPVPESDATAIVLLATEPPKAGAGKLTLVFDIDAFCRSNLDPKSEELWTRLEKLRDLKNTIFFKSTTKKAKELFK
jgi:uncharacterized protein (TIGR04255 family)